VARVRAPTIAGARETRGTIVATNGMATAGGGAEAVRPTIGVTPADGGRTPASVHHRRRVGGMTVGIVRHHHQADVGTPENEGGQDLRAALDRQMRNVGGLVSCFVFFCYLLLY
jgi:hypothetical protein